jgi:hypothetical protein
MRNGAKYLLHPVVLADNILTAMPALKLFAKLLHESHIPERLDAPDDRAFLIF